MLKLFREIETEIGEIEVFVFNIGGNVRFDIRDTTARVYRKVWEMTAFAAFLTAREAAKAMVPRGRGTMLFTGATASLRGGRGFSAFAGGKRMLVDRIEWIVMPDSGTVTAALQSGEVDWWEQPIPDVVPLLRKNRNVMVDTADPLGNVGALRINHLHPPFNDVRTRRAILTALSQEDYMRAIVGDDATASLRNMETGQQDEIDQVAVLPTILRSSRLA